VAIGFRMNLFNIGVDGQYRLAAFTAAVVGGSVELPKPLHILLIVVTAMLVGAMWAGIAAILKVTRGVSEVISTIMLNAIATALIAYLLRRSRSRSRAATTSAPSRSRSPGRLPGCR
jgi:simple sugar transport system permease protein